jgi:precorrin isomerase
MARNVHPIEMESYRRLRATVDLSALAPLSRAVAERVIHASADVEYAHDLVLDEDALRSGLMALRAGAPVVVDTRMVAAGIPGLPAHCGLDDAPSPGSHTRSAAGIRRAAARVGPGAVYVIGCAPTALVALLELEACPALVIGLPVGFVGAVEAKQALRDSGRPAVTNCGPKGGAAVAAAALNALHYWDGSP